MVLGMHRSGTSALTRIINLMGAYFGPEHLHLGANQHNPKGYWERTDVIQINEQILAATGSRWYRPASTELSARLLPSPLEHTIQRLILGLDAHRPWVIKDPRLCLTAPFWLKAMERPLLVICARDAHAVARSLQARDSMPYEYALTLWEHYAVALLKCSFAQPKIHVRYEDLVQDPAQSVKRMHTQFLEFGVEPLRLPGEEELHAFLQRRPESDHAAVPPPLSDAQLSIQSMLRGETPVDINIDVSAHSRELMAQVIQGPPFG